MGRGMLSEYIITKFKNLDGFRLLKSTSLEARGAAFSWQNISRYKRREIKKKSSDLTEWAKKVMLSYKMSLCTNICDAFASKCPC